MFSLRSVVGLHLNRSITNAIVAEGSVFTINRGLATASNVNVREKSRRKDRTNAKEFERANPQIFSTRVVNKKKDAKKEEEAKVQPDPEADFEDRLKEWEQIQHFMQISKESEKIDPPQSLEVPVVNFGGETVGTMTLPEYIFATPVRPDVLHRVVTWQLAKRRRGTAKAQTRGDAHGSRRKLHKQKGTGRARVGDNRSAIRVGGGVAFPPKPRDFSYDLPKKVRSLGLRSALASKFAQRKLIILDSTDNVEISKTKDLRQHIEERNWQNVLLIDNEKINDNLLRASLNLKDIDYLPRVGINVYDILRRDLVILHKDVIPYLMERFENQNVPRSKGSVRRKRSLDSLVQQVEQININEKINA
jgi:large subunit ribosomal protein L4